MQYTSDKFDQFYELIKSFNWKIENTEMSINAQLDRKSQQHILDTDTYKYMISLVEDLHNDYEKLKNIYDSISEEDST